MYWNKYLFYIGTYWYKELNKVQLIEKNAYVKWINLWDSFDRIFNISLLYSMTKKYEKNGREDIIK